MKRESKSWQRFEGKIRNLKQYLQLMDAVLSIANNKCLSVDETHTIATALGVTTDSHRQLNIPNKRKDIARTFVSSRRLLNEQAFIELHCLFSDYIAHIVSEIAHSEPNRLLSILGNDSERSILFSEIIQLKDYDSILREMASRVFRILENMRSTSDMMNKLCKITKINIDQTLLQEALVYIEVRHIIIHRDSSVDEKFIKRDANGLIPLNKTKLQLKYPVTNKAINTIYELCRTIDNALIELNVLQIRKQ